MAIQGAVLLQGVETTQRICIVDSTVDIKSFFCQGLPNTIADGLRMSVSEMTWPIIQEHVDDVFTVTEEEIIYATRLVLERMKIVIEPSSGVVLAVVLTERFKKATAGLKNIAVLLCGGNLDIDKFPPRSK